MSEEGAGSCGPGIMDGWLWASIWVTGREPGTSARAVSALNCLAAALVCSILWNEQISMWKYHRKEPVRRLKTILHPTEKQRKKTQVHREELCKALRRVTGSISLSQERQKVEPPSYNSSWWQTRECSSAENHMERSMCLLNIFFKILICKFILSFKTKTF